MFELIVALVLIGLNAVFSLSELAIVSARKVRLKTLAEQGRPGARAALRLADDPGRFLSTVQIGITLIGVLAGAFSGAALGDRLGAVLRQAGMSEGAAQGVGFGLVIGVITYLSVVVGELVPKQIALRNPESFACAMAPLMSVVSRVCSPIVFVLDASSKALFRLLGVPVASETAVTEEEVKTVVAEAEAAGAIEAPERDMIAGVLRLGDRAVRGIMTPRTDVDWVDLTGSDATLRERLIATSHSRIPAGEGSPDAMVGILQVRDIVADLLRGEPFDPRRHVRKAPSIPDTLDALDALDTLRRADVPMALVHDEYGHFEGLITPADILDAIAGAFRSDELPGAEPEAVQREDASWLIAGWMPADEMAELLRMVLPERRTYETAAGLVIEALQRLPATGEVVEVNGWRFEVVDMDGLRVDKLLVSRVAAQDE